MSAKRKRLSDMQSPSLSGDVHARDQDGAFSSPESRRRPRSLRQEVQAYDHPQVLCFAARNRRGRFYIPCTTNNFGGVHVAHVLIDSGCSSLLLPFPLNSSFPQALLLQARYKWTVSFSRGTGAIHSPVLKITMHLGGGFPCTLAGKEQPRLPMLRFHVGSDAARQLLDTQNLRSMLDDNCIRRLNDFLQQMGDRRHSPERTYALLGQSYLSEVMYCQKGDVAITFSNDFIDDGSESIVDIMGLYHQKLVPLVGAFEGFLDLEDDDGDEDEEDYRLSWVRACSDDEVDEPDGR